MGITLVLNLNFGNEVSKKEGFEHCLKIKKYTIDFAIQNHYKNHIYSKIRVFGETIMISVKNSQNTILIFIAIRCENLLWLKSQKRINTFRN